MKRILYLYFIALLFLLCFFCSSSSEKINTKGEWSGKILVENKVTKIYNPSFPTYGEIKFDLEEVLSIGDVEDENCFFYKGFDFDIDQSGNIYILDYGKIRIQKFDQNGKFLKTIGRQGQGPGEFMSPSSLDISDSGDFYLKDSNSILKILGKDGQFKSQKILPYNFNSLKQIGNFELLLIINELDFRERENVYKLTQINIKGKKIFEYINVRHKSMVGDGSEKIFIYFPEIDPAIYYDISKNGYIYCGINTEYTIYKFKNSELKAKIFIDYKPVPLSKADIDKLLNRTYFKYPPHILRMIKDIIPKNNPLFSSIILYENDWLYVFRKETLNKNDYYIVDIINPEGKYLFKTRLKWIPGKIMGNYFWVKVQNQDDDFLLKKYKVKNFKKYIM